VTGFTISPLVFWLRCHVILDRYPLRHIQAASIEIRRLAALARKQDICLVCWCAPKACHADIITRTIAPMGRA